MCKSKVSKMVSFKKSRGQIILIAQEIELAKELASNNKATRDKALRKLKKWFTSRSQGLHKFEKHDFLRIWKGLFYCMWMSDKLLVQEELAQEISNLVHSLSTLSTALEFVRSAFTALSIEWFGIDDLRINKFMMLVRRIIRQSFTLMQTGSWNKKDVKALADMYYFVLSENSSLGLKLHLIEIYCEELAKIGGEDVSANTVLTLISPFGKYMASSKDGRLISHITRHVFLHLIHQSDAGIEYEARFNAWKQLGFPGGTIDAIERMDPEESDGEDEFKYAEDGDEPKLNELDPRAGRVNVELPSLVFEPKSFISFFTTLKNSQETTVKARKTIVNLIQKFEKLSEGKFPLGIHEVDLPEVESLKKEILRTSKKLLRKQMTESENNLEDEDNDGESQETTVKSKRKSTMLKWNVTETVKKKNVDLGKETVAGLKKTNNWQVKPSLNKRKIADDVPVGNILPGEGTPQIKRQKLKNMVNFQISKTQTQEKSVASQIKSTKQKNSKENKLNKMKMLGKAKENSIILSTKSLSFKDKSSKRGINSNLKKKNNAKLNKSVGKDNTRLVKTNQVGLKDEWDSNLQEGETEIFIPSKKYMQKLKEGGGGSAAMVEFLKRHLSESEDKIMNPFAFSPRNKKVEFVLGLNTSQEHKEYRRSLKRNSDIPFDALNKPKKGVLKSTPVGSPINPFFEIDRS